MYASWSCVSSDWDAATTANTYSSLKKDALTKPANGLCNLLRQRHAARQHFMKEANDLQIETCLYIG